jgi:hypothetical protein
MFFICSPVKQEPLSADQAATPSQPSTDHIGEDTRYCRGILANLLDIGNEMAAILAHQIRSQTDDPEAAQKTVTAFATLSQSTRRTIMLHEKLGQPKKNPARRIAARKRIIRDVEDAIESTARHPGEQESLHAELLERLDRPELEDEIASRATPDIVVDICRDLGIAGPHGTRPGKRRIPHDIAILNARAEQLPGAAPSAELLALLASAPPPPPRSPGRITPLASIEVSKLSDEELESRIQQLALLRES